MDNFPGKKQQDSSIKVAIPCPEKVSKFTKIGAAVVRHDKKYKVFKWRFGLLEGLHLINPFHKFVFETDDGEEWRNDE